ncbi:hypothetical protein AV530_019579 [Patagioenas fasciata monilis]|uniref:Uncharacterized protein n=1 Tax=Patagioenas fasciata monilis TaxID=372326 RepID=A0A1V4JE78_PATFA|nr:hypothetical protein AV530_019579 [Patagioenas fasciata monilis]
MAHVDQQPAGFQSPLPELELVVTKCLVQPGDQGHPTGLDEKTYKPLTKLHELSESQQQEMGQFTQHPQGWLLEICN